MSETIVVRKDLWDQMHELSFLGSLTYRELYQNVSNARDGLLVERDQMKADLKEMYFFLAEVAPSWLPERLRADRRKLLNKHVGKLV